MDNEMGNKYFGFPYGGGVFDESSSSTVSNLIPLSFNILQEDGFDLQLEDNNNLLLEG